MASVRKSSNSDIWIDRTWRVATHPAAIGALVGVAGLICVVGPLNTLPDMPTASWWTTTFQSDGMARAAASIFSAAVVLFAGIGLTRWRARRGEGVEGVPDGVPDGRTSPWGLVAVILMAAGIGSGVLTWLVAGSHVPPTRVSLPVGRQIESYPAIAVQGQMRVMLPSRLRVEKIEIEAGTADLKLSKVGEEGLVQTLRVGEPVDIDGMRYTLAGIEYDPRVMRAAFTSSQENTIPASANVGASFQVTLDGPEYKVVQLARDYLNAMGPAVELESEATGKFWVFQRARPVESLETPGGLRLEGLETAPVALIAISRGQPVQWFAASGVLFLFGFALLLFVRDRFRATARGGEGAWSFNEAHTLEEGPWKA